MVLNNVSQLKHIQLTKHMHYCIEKIYHVYYTTQWNFIILRKFSHMTLTSPNKKWRKSEPKKITPNCNALAKSIISYLWVS